MRETTVREKLLPVALCVIVLIVLQGCARRVNQEKTGAAPDTRAAHVSQPVRLSTGDADAAEPAMAAGLDGTIFVAWVEHHPNSEADVMFARLNPEGQMQGSPVRINQKPGEATAWRGDPPTIAVAPDGTVFVGWTARVGAPSAHATDVYLSSSHDGGATFGAPLKVNDDQKPAVHGMHSLAAGTDGRLYLAWLDERNIVQPQSSTKAEGHHMESNRELFMTSSTDGGRSFAPNKRVATDVCPCCKTALAIGPDGRLYLSWRQVLPGDFRHIAVSSSTDGGGTFSQPVIVSDDQWMLQGCPVSGASLSVGADGTLRVLWFSAGERGQPGLYRSESRDGGGTFSPRQLVAASAARGTPVLLAGVNQLSAVWEGDDSGHAKVMTAPLTGVAPDSTGQVVTTDGELPAAATNGARLFVAYIMKAGEQQGVFVISAQSGEALNAFSAR
jgi:hypothetical protein